MKYLIKFLALTGLAGAVVYSFYVQPEISNYGFWIWALTIVVSLITIGNFAILIASSMETEDDTEKGMLIFSSFLSSLIFTAIYFFTTSNDIVDWPYLLSCFIVYILASGFNKRTWSFLFFVATQYLFFCCEMIQMNAWHSWGIYMLFVIIHIVCIICVIFEHLDSDSPPMLELIGLLFPIVAVIYIWQTNGNTLGHDLNTITLLGYFIISLLASFRDDTSTYLTQLLPFELFSKKFCLKISELGLEIV